MKRGGRRPGGRRSRARGSAERRRRLMLERDSRTVPQLEQARGEVRSRSFRFSPPRSISVKYRSDASRRPCLPFPAPRPDNRSKSPVRLRSWPESPHYTARHVSGGEQRQPKMPGPTRAVGGISLANLHDSLRLPGRDPGEVRARGRLLRGRADPRPARVGQKTGASIAGLDPGAARRAAGAGRAARGRAGPEDEPATPWRRSSSRTRSSSTARPATSSRSVRSSASSARGGSRGRGCRC